MTWTDVATAASTIATVVAAVFTVLAFFKGAPGKRAALGASSKTSIVLVAILAILSWVAVAFDYAERHRRPFAYTAVVKQWRVAAPLSYFLEANATALFEFKSSHNLMLILCVPYADTDRMTDKLIEKSHPYTIVGNAIMLAH